MPPKRSSSRDSAAPPSHTHALRAIWERNADVYRLREIGSGSKAFVKQCLLSPDLFALREGELATDRRARRLEFIDEKPTKAGRTADFVIYVNGDLVIPVEVERYGQIALGESQIRQYQLDLREKLGILTDGSEWRFYNNRRFHTFSLDKLLSQPDGFKDFWKQYTAPESYYTNFFSVGPDAHVFEALPLAEPDDLCRLALKAHDISAEDVRRQFFDDVTTLIRVLNGRFELSALASGGNESKRKTELTYAYVIQYILYKTLVDNNYAGYAVDHETRLDSIRRGLSSGSYKEILSTIRAVSRGISQSIYRPFLREQQEIASQLEELLDKPDLALVDISPWLDIFVFIHRYNFEGIESDIFGYVYENFLKELYHDEPKGQFFTDPALVEFMMDEVGYTSQTVRTRMLENRGVSIADPSCGSGTFLLSATRRLVQSTWDRKTSRAANIESRITTNVFGLDVEEFPLYLAEMNVLMQLLPVICANTQPTPLDQRVKVIKTRDSLAEFLDTDLNNTVADAQVARRNTGGQLGMFAANQTLSYSSFLRDPADLAEMKSSVGVRPSIPRLRFDFVVGNPPYIGYNTASKEHVEYFELMREGKASLSNVYGVNLHSAPGRRKTYPPKPNLYAFFLALGLALLKDDGQLCYVIPQSLLTENDYDVLRDYLARNSTIESIVTFTGHMFVGRGLAQQRQVATSSLVISVRKAQPLAGHEVRIVNYSSKVASVAEAVADLRKTRATIETSVPQADLLANVGNWNFLTQSAEFKALLRAYRLVSTDMELYYAHDRSRVALGTQFYFDVGFTLDVARYKEGIAKASDYYILDHRNFAGISDHRPTHFYPGGSSHIGLTKNSQGMATLQQRYKIVWSVKNPRGFFITEDPIVFPMGNSGVIAGDNPDEMYYLFGILNSRLSRVILEGAGRIPNERSGFLVPITRIKEALRVPIVTSHNDALKRFIGESVARLVALERERLADLVDLSRSRLRNATSVRVEGSDLVLGDGAREIRCPIKRDRTRVRRVVKEALGDQTELGITPVSLGGIHAVDAHTRQLILGGIDEAVFTLYFRGKEKFRDPIDVPTLKLDNRKSPLYESVFCVDLSAWD